jgi:hypothetical protein
LGEPGISGVPTGRRYWAGRGHGEFGLLFFNYKNELSMPCGKKRKRHKIATHKRKKRLRKNRHKKKNK